MEIEFRESAYRFDFKTLLLWFDALVSGRQVLCNISLEALQDHFGATEPDDAESAFLSHRIKIESIAEDRIRAGFLTQSGRVAIRTTELMI